MLRLLPAPCRGHIRPAAVLLLQLSNEAFETHSKPDPTPPSHLGVMTMTLAVSGSILHAACMLWMVPGVKNSQLLSPTSTPCLSCLFTDRTQTK